MQQGQFCTSLTKKNCKSHQHPTLRIINNSETYEDLYEKLTTIIGFFKAEKSIKKLPSVVI